MYYLGLDIGSSSVKVALVIQATGKSIDVVQEPEGEMSIESKKVNWAEQDPELWWTHVCKAIKRIKTKHRISRAHIKGIGISYQMHGLVVVDQNGQPLRKAIIWCDSRAVKIGQEAFKALGPQKCKSSLLNSPANFTASKLKWLQEKEPRLYSKIFKFMLPGDYIAYKFSNKISTTIAGLSEAILWDFKKEEPAKFLLDHYAIDPDLIPKIVGTFEKQATVSAKGGDESGLMIGTPITYRAGDQPNNALSLNVFNPGEVAATGGTSGVIYAITDNLSVKESARVNNFAHVNYKKGKAPRVGKLLCINGAGIQYRWLLNNLSVKSYQEMNSLAAEVDIGSDGLCMLPFGNGAERMFDNKVLGTSLHNVNLNIHSKAHICRAALEGIAFSFVYGMEILKADGIEVKVLRVGNDNLFRSELFASTIATLIGHDIEIFNTTGAIGAARAAGLYSGDFNKFADQIMTNDHLRTVKPGDELKKYTKAYKKWKVNLQLQLDQLA